MTPVTANQHIFKSGLIVNVLPEHSERTFDRALRLRVIWPQFNHIYLVSFLKKLFNVLLNPMCLRRKLK